MERAVHGRCASAVARDHEHAVGVPGHGAHGDLAGEGGRALVAAHCKKPTNRPIRTQDCAQIASAAAKWRPQRALDPLLATRESRFVEPKRV